MAVGALGLLDTILGEWGYHRGGGAAWIDVARDVIVMWSFIVAGLVAWSKRPRSRVGSLMVAVGLSWPLWNLQFLPIPALVTLGFWLQGLNKAFLGYLVLAFPTGRLSSRVYRAVVWLTFLHVVGLGFLHAALLDPNAYYSCGGCTPLFVLHAGPGAFDTIDQIYNLGSGLIALLYVALVVRRWLKASPPSRRALAPVWLAGGVIALLVVTDAARTFTELSDSVQGALTWAQDTSMTLVPLAFLFGLLRVRTARGPVGQLAIDLKGGGSAARLRETLARALGDPSLQIAFPTTEAGRYIDEDGRPFALPDEASGRSLTLVQDDREPLAMLVHDPALEEEEELLHAVGAVATLALENERLHAEVKAQLEEVRASRARIVQAADEERRRVERNIHDGAQQRLVTLSLALRVAQERVGAEADPAVTATLRDAADELASALSELRELARGIHPAILTEAGLGAALQSLAERSAVPATVSASLEHRLAPPVEATAYFVVSEALANVAKYAEASSVHLDARMRDERLVVRVADDGIGGADLSNGSGLRGLSDRVAALGGQLEVISPTGGGTTVLASIPCPAS